MIIHNLVLRDYDKFIVKVNNEIVDCDYKQITKENVELILEGKILTGNVVKLILVNEIYESKLHIKNLYIFGLLVSIFRAPEEGLLGNPLTHVCEFKYNEAIVLNYKDELFKGCKTELVQSWLECNEANYTSWLCIMRILTNLACLVISILLFMIASNIEMLLASELLFLLLNVVLIIYSK